ncbi:hypothetical protein [Exiguobacterium acetylicum]|uniref:hypothetical protein n=1 Tax=Exiguobacterium acetylicum TaxID=41170 RepID=UPI001EE28CED|nr:hypothetical protein [Exiguobacterium acetylicum]UKS54894.1 hypothetical protein K6T22_10050 [Exiguobacterium acetylicum]
MNSTGQTKLSNASPSHSKTYVFKRREQEQETLVLISNQIRRFTTRAGQIVRIEEDVKPISAAYSILSNLSGWTYDGMLLETHDVILQLRAEGLLRDSAHASLRSHMKVGDGR